ncbi:MULTISPECIES: plasmid partitioning protein RepB [unclassified Aminobacter]|uniref:plasmid partitioning protein RepB n=1 Tax=unclassified Aminobacter TaxID=2644704 RepID=UPI000463D9E3|nr:MULTISPECIES: plasmid partitioning protein RepB [unclassified Aminobacter]TWH31354.1 ParB family chromosome partitioning protein [Aminobacter sp. J15]
MNARKDRLKSLFAGEVPEATPEAVAPLPAADAVKRTPSAAVRAMGLSLGSLSQEAEEAKRLREALAAGEQVVELDPNMLERSPFADRLSDGAVNDPEFLELKESLREHGQQVPVLVRPHPDPAKAASGHYQLAYGHRRAQAARELGLKIRAVVRQLDDAALALAQGKENAERRDLSFIERAFFAKTLVDHGFDRATAMAALSVHKSEMSRLIQVAEAIPPAIVRAIGPAPKAGRPRWLELGELLEKDKAGLAAQEIASEDFAAADSDTRFQRLFDRLQRSAQGRGAKPKAEKPKTIKGEAGIAIAELARAGKNARLTIPASAGQGFADYVAARLPELHAAFVAGSKEE